MNTIILALALIILLCVLFNRISGKLGIPVLLAFIILGMLFGSDGIMKVAFDNYQISEYVCSFALIFIMLFKYDVRLQVIKAKTIKLFKKGAH